MIVDVLMFVLGVVITTLVYTLGVRKGFKSGAEYVIKELERHR